MLRTSRLSSIALGAIASLSLAACSSSGGSGSTTAANAGGGSGGASGSHGVLTVLDYWTQSPGKTVLESFLKSCDQKTGYTFKTLSVAQSELITKATQLTASGDAPAMIVSDNNQVPTLADAGVLAPFDATAAGLKAADFLPGPYGSANYKGTQYGVPVGNNGEILVYNTKMLRAAGVRPPRTWSQLQDAAAKLTKGGVYGWAVTMGTGETNTWNWLSQLWSNGGSIADLTSPQAVAAADFWTSFIRKGTAPRASLKWESTDIEAQFVAGKLAIAQMGTWMLPQLIKDAAAKGISYQQMQQVAPDGKSLITPFGGEVFTVGAGAKGAAQKAVAQCIGLWNDTNALMKNDAALGYVPSYKPAQAQYLADHPELKVLIQQLQHSRSRTTEVGAAYNAYSAAIAAALQQIAIGQRTPKDALAAAAAAGKQAQ